MWIELIKNNKQRILKRLRFNLILIVLIYIPVLLLSDFFISDAFDPIYEYIFSGILMLIWLTIVEILIIKESKKK